MPTSIRSSGDLLADRRFAWAEASLAAGDPVGAADIAGQVIDIVPGYAPAWLLLGNACIHAGMRSPENLGKAWEAFRRVLELDPPDSLGAGSRIGLFDDGDGTSTLSPAYVTNLFDGYASRFDSHLVDGLGYRGHELLLHAIVTAASRTGRQPHFPRVIDLGCGTGLMANALAGMFGFIEGVDLSPGMLAKARDLGVYGALHAGEMVGFLKGQEHGSVDLVVAADALVYVGDLAPVMAAARSALDRHGLFAFTLQSQERDGLRLGEDGRYAHGADVIGCLPPAHGLEAVLVEAVSVRRQAGVPVPGWLVVLGNP